MHCGKSEPARAAAEAAIPAGKIGHAEDVAAAVAFLAGEQAGYITGLGTVNPTGNTVAESWANIKAGRCAVGPITAFDTADFKVKLAAEVKDFDPAARIDKREARKMARFTQFAVAPPTKLSATAALRWKKLTICGLA